MANVELSSRYDLTQDQLHELLSYDGETGVFVWRQRPRSMFESDRNWKKWNTRYAGKIAGKSSGMKYRQIMIRPYLYYSHRLAWLYEHGVWPSPEVDHINGDGHDNRIANLRVANRKQNLANTKIHTDNESGFKGVRLDKRRGHFVARLFTDGKERHLGSFPTAEEAHCAYIKAASEHHGAYAQSGDAL